MAVSSLPSSHRSIQPQRPFSTGQRTAREMLVASAWFDSRLTKRFKIARSLDRHGPLPRSSDLCPRRERQDFISRHASCELPSMSLGLGVLVAQAIMRWRRDDTATPRIEEARELRDVGRVGRVKNTRQKAPHWPERGVCARLVLYVVDPNLPEHMEYPCVRLSGLSKLCYRCFPCDSSRAHWRGSREVRASE
jgi:hypothetical protein